jgi:two-component sensor histidine kinase
LALVVHELIVNAATYGALSSPGGGLSIRWSRGPAEGGFTLQWIESGGPPPSLSPESGFGTAMVSRMIEQQLQGALHHEWSAGGLMLTLSLPGAPPA